MGYIEESPFARIKNVRLPQKIIESFGPEEEGAPRQKRIKSTIGLLSRSSRLSRAVDVKRPVPQIVIT
jgi:hypothetical protein